MRPLGSAAVLVIGLAFSGCGATLDGFSTSSSETLYPATSYYGAPVYTQGYYAEPTYGAPYGYQPNAIPSYGYPPHYCRRDGGGWRERQWQEHREQGFQHEGRPTYLQQGQGGGNIPPAAQPRSFPAGPPPQMAPQPPPATRSQADQNKRLVDQLGFRPSR